MIRALRLGVKSRPSLDIGGTWETGPYGGEQSPLCKTAKPAGVAIGET